ncbi:site-specific integrase [Silvimonas sp.]|uniref:tyrosine-type recombinase/integrase n=1 Tax=Silvimonas sp. TaxID=2650811 RepID=UPI0028440CAF|nr:site-specific integrase [Silvimonas sp.]MDR3428843.1 site-specific integrase [Silvimonas sp.]
MPQAKTLSPKELRRVLDYVATKKHAARNRLMILMTHFSGMRVGEVAALLKGDVLNSDGTVKDEIRLSAEQTKGRHARTVFVNEKLRREIAAYLKTIPRRADTAHLFATQKRSAFSANTACQTLNMIYERAGIAGASSHSGRRSFITTLSSRGVGVRVLAKLAGHRSLASVMPYIDASDDMLRNAVELAG